MKRPRGSLSWTQKVLKHIFDAKKKPKKVRGPMVLGCLVEERRRAPGVARQGGRDVVRKRVSPVFHGATGCAMGLRGTREGERDAKAALIVAPLNA